MCGCVCVPVTSGIWLDNIFGHQIYLRVDVSRTMTVTGMMTTQRITPNQHKNNNVLVTVQPAFELLKMKKKNYA